jgi:hypothetical protein
MALSGAQLVGDVDGVASVSGLYLLRCVPVTVCAVATVTWEGSPGVTVFG